VTDSAKAISAQYDKKISEIRAKSYGSNRGQFYNDLNNANEQIISYMNYLVNRPYSKSVEAAYHILWQCAEKHSQIYGSGGNVQYPQYRGMLMEDIVSEINRHTKV